MITNLIKEIKHNPKILVLIDGVGALVTAFFLGFVLVQLESFFGIPSSVLYVLAVIPIFYALYDFYCYQKENLQIGKFLKRIAIMNLIYCCISLGMAFYHKEPITIFGWIYVIIEIIIIVGLAIFELKTSKEMMNDE